MSINKRNLTTQNSVCKFTETQRCKSINQQEYTEDENAEEHIMETEMTVGITILRVLAPVGILLGMSTFIQKKNKEESEKMKKRMTRDEEQTDQPTKRVWSLDI